MINKEEISKSVLSMFYLLLLIILSWWFLAFVQVPSYSAEWISTLQRVCFGTGENGLPASYGWMMLIGVPLTLLACLLIVWKQEFLKVFHHLKKKNSLKALTLLIILLFFGESLWITQKIRFALQVPKQPTDFTFDGSLPENYPISNQVAHDFELLDQNGQTLSLKKLQGRLIYLSFAYAHCETICPAIVQQVQAAYEKTLELSPILIIVTLDPWRDTPSSLPKLAQKWKLKPDQYVVSGPIETVLSVLEAYHMPINRDNNTGDISHPSLVYIIGKDGLIKYVLNNASTKMISDAAIKSERL